MMTEKQWQRRLTRRVICWMAILTLVWLAAVLEILSRDPKSLWYMYVTIIFLLAINLMPIMYKVNDPYIDFLGWLNGKRKV